MKDDTSRKDVTDRFALGRHVANVNNLWSYETRCSTSNKKILFFICMGSKSEITQGKVAAFLFSKHNIFGFKISVYDPKFGQITESSENVLNNLSDLMRFHLFIVLNRLILTFRTQFNCSPYKYYKIAYIELSVSYTPSSFIMLSCEICLISLISFQRDYLPLSPEYCFSLEKALTATILWSLSLYAR